MSAKHFSELDQQVIKPDLCRHCGACALICPVDVIGMKENGACLLGECVSCGLCLQVCPVLNQHRELPVSEAFLMRPISEVPGSKTCGVVSTIASCLLKEGRVDAVLVSKMDVDMQEKSYLARSQSQVYEAAGANYFSKGHLTALREAVKKGERVAVIGTGCCIEGARLIGKISPKYASSMPYLLGLFCTSQLEQNTVRGILEKNAIDPSTVESINIRGGIVAVRDLHGRSNRLELSEMSLARRASCSYCFDLDNSTADLSFGEMGAPTGYVITLVRTGAGREAVELSRERLQHVVMPSSTLDELQRVRLKKYMRFVRNLGRTSHTSE